MRTMQDDGQKEVYFVRHGHSEFNDWRDGSLKPPFSFLWVGDPMIFDAQLSARGR
jgi:hypothetical protein